MFNDLAPGRCTATVPANDLVDTLGALPGRPAAGRAARSRRSTGALDACQPKIAFSRALHARPPRLLRQLGQVDVLLRRQRPLRCASSRPRSTSSTGTRHHELSTRSRPREQFDGFDHGVFDPLPGRRDAADHRLQPVPRRRQAGRHLQPRRRAARTMRRIAAILVALVASGGDPARGQRRRRRRRQLRGPGDLRQRRLHRQRRARADRRRQRRRGQGRRRSPCQARPSRRATAAAAATRARPSSSCRSTTRGSRTSAQDASCLIRPQSLIGEKYVDCKPTAAARARAPSRRRR